MTDRRICPTSGKICYRGRMEARRAHRHAHFRIRIYACDDCGCWHTTNNEKRRDRDGDDYHFNKERP